MGEQGQLKLEAVVVDDNNIGVANSSWATCGFRCFLSSSVVAAAAAADSPPVNVVVVTVEVVAASVLYNFMKKYGGEGASEAPVASMFPSLSSRRRSCLAE